MGLGECGKILGVALVLSVLVEVAQWYLSTRKEEYRSLVAEVRRRKQAVEDEKNKSLTEKNEKKALNRVKLQEARLKEKVTELYKSTMKAQLIPSLAMMLFIPFILKHFKGTVVATLPFEPFSLVRRITQQGLTDPAPRDCSGSCFYFLAMALMRAVVKRFMGPLSSSDAPTMSELTAMMQGSASD